MKTIFAAVLFVVFASPAFAQDQAAAARAAAGCGPDQVSFDVKTDKKQHPAPQAVEQSNSVNIGTVTTRVGLDGAWVGAIHGKSYFFFSVDPGSHRVCAAWQSNFKRLSKLGSAADLTAEAGQVYYLRVRVDERPEHRPDVKMEHIDTAEAQLLISSSSFSTSQPKK